MEWYLPSVKEGHSGRYDHQRVDPNGEEVLHLELINNEYINV
jgi:hypothetical protein